MKTLPIHHDIRSLGEKLVHVGVGAGLRVTCSYGDYTMTYLCKLVRGRGECDDKVAYVFTPRGDIAASLNFSANNVHWFIACENQVRCITEGLKEVGRDMHKYAQDYADMFGECTFCGRVLSNETSVRNGYGPVCAHNFDLPYRSELK